MARSSGKKLSQAIKAGIARKKAAESAQLAAAVSVHVSKYVERPELARLRAMHVVIEAIRPLQPDDRETVIAAVQTVLHSLPGLSGK